MDAVGGMVLELAGKAGQSLAELSRMLGRNDAYLHQFIHRGSPRRLAEADRRLLAAHFGVAETLLGATEPDAIVRVPFIAVRAAAGSGVAPHDERVIREEPFAPAVLRDAGIAPASAALVTAAGDSMRETILDGDRLLLDRAETVVRDRAIYVFRCGDAVSVKRLSNVSRGLRLGSDNADYPSDIVDPREVTVIGRVKLLVRVPR